MDPAGYIGVERACLIALVMVLPFGALACDRSLDAGSPGGAWLAMVGMAVATVNMFVLAHDLAGRLD
jgi:hypothetical protein